MSEKNDIHEPKKKRFEHIELPAKLLDYLLRSHESNINQSMVHSNRVVRKRPAESNGTPAMDLRLEDIRIRRSTNKSGIEQNTHR